MISNGWLLSMWTLFLIICIFCRDSVILLFSTFFTGSSVLSWSQMFHTGTVIFLTWTYHEGCSSTFPFSTLLPMLTFLELIDLVFPPKISQNVSTHVVAWSVTEKSIALIKVVLLPLSLPFFYILRVVNVYQYFAQAVTLGLS